MAGLAPGSYQTTNFEQTIFVKQAFLSTLKMLWRWVEIVICQRISQGNTTVYKVKTKDQFIVMLKFMGIPKVLIIQGNFYTLPSGQTTADFEFARPSGHFCT